MVVVTLIMQVSVRRKSSSFQVTVLISNSMNVNFLVILIVKPLDQLSRLRHD
jgi:hypothetical protein